MPVVITDYLSLRCPKCGRIVHDHQIVLEFETGEEIYKAGCSNCKSVYAELTLDNFNMDIIIRTIN